jgi:Fe(3+) dicitrate transport protein
MKRFATLTLLIPAALAIDTQVARAQGSVAGTVRAASGAPIQGAVVRVPSQALRAASDAQGRYRLDRVRTGQVVITAAAEGFVTARRTVQAPASGELTVDLTLEASLTTLGAVLVQERQQPGTVRPLPDQVGTLITAGARSEVVSFAGTDANLAEKVGRQTFARVPGLLVYDMDGAGNQTNVSTRGLDPHRSWEFNVRQDGIPVNSDLYGYPASHYSAPQEAMEEVRLVRGTAALQYGSQFGGLLDYRTKRPDTTRAFAAGGSMTMGSYDLRNLFGSFGGRVGSIEYQGYGAWRQTNGYRESAHSKYDAQYLAATWSASPTFTLRTQVGRSWYRHRIPGPLTDAMFADDPRTSTRTRNWFSPTIWVPALIADWRPRPGTRVTAQLNGVFGDRSSVQFVGLATVPDEPNAGTGEFGTRAVDIDDFNSRTAELRLTQDHRLGSLPSVLATGVTISRNGMRRRQQGVGSRGADYDLTITGSFGRDLRYHSQGVSWYAEELVRVTPRWTVIPGARIESGRTDMTGTLAYYDPADTPRRVEHGYPLFGFRTEYRISDATEFYGGWSEAFRPFLLKDLLPENALERTDREMKDARGWTVETGLRGRLGARVSYDVGAFLMRYDDRMGGVVRDDGGGPYTFKTNVGSTRTIGMEVTMDALLMTTERMALRSFVAASVFDAIYREGNVVVSGANISIEGNEAEGVPRTILRTGLTASASRGSVSLLASHTSRSYADARNTVTPPATGAVGIVPEYMILDLSASYRLGARATVRAGVGNILDEQYFTKRPAFYPGPGVWSSDGRSARLTLEFAP